MSREIKIVTPENVELTFELAGIGSRFIAILLDSLIQAGIAMVLVLAFLGLAWGGLNLDLGWFSPWVIAIVSLIFFVLTTQYFLYFEAAKNGQTPGKKAAGIRVIRDTGHPIDFRAAFLRNIMRVVDVLPFYYCVGFVSIFASSEYRRVGDYVAGTLVVRTLVVRTGSQHHSAIDVAKEQGKSWYSPVPTPGDGAPSIPRSALPYLGTVTRDDYRALRHLLDRRVELDELVVRSLAEKLASPMAAKLHIDPSEIGEPTAFLETLAREWERRMIH